MRKRTYWNFWHRYALENEAKTHSWQGEDVTTRFNSAGLKWLELAWRSARDWIGRRNGSAVWHDCFLRRMFVRYKGRSRALRKRTLKIHITFILKADCFECKVWLLTVKHWLYAPNVNPCSRITVAHKITYHGTDNKLQNTSCCL